MVLALQLLGPPAIEVDGQPLRVDTRKATALLAHLVLEGPQRRETLAALLWPESTETRARAALRRTLSVLNRALDERWLDSGRARVGLTGDWWCDVTAFRAAVAETAAHAHHGPVCASCVAALQRAAALYRGGFLTGFALRDSAEFDEWMIVVTEELRRECGSVLERLVDGLADLGRVDDAITQARRLVGLDQLHEPAHRRLMQLYADCGRRADAVRQYRECVAILDRELGVRPLDETTALHRAIVEDRLPARPPAPPPPPPTPALPGPPDEAPLVGRDDVLADLLAAYDRIGDGGRLLGVAGEAGIGKTRVARAVAARVAARGATVLTVRCQPGDRQLAYAPVAELLRGAGARGDAGAWLATLPGHWRAEAGRLVPGLADDHAVPAEPLTSPGAQTRFVEGIWQVLGAALAGPAPGLVVFDDVHWADASTQQLLAYVTTRLRGRPIALLCCWRTDELDPGHPWDEAVRATEDAGTATVVALQRLDVEDVTALLPASADAERRAALGARVHAEAEGLPLAVVAYLEELDDAGSDDRWALPRTLEQLFRARVAGLDGTARQVLTAAAATGRSFDFDTAMAASGRTDAETVAALEVLTARGMVREVDAPTGAPRYDFTHDKLRSVVYEAASLARRRLLHGRIADALRVAARSDDGASGVAGLVARHEQLAGREEQAARTYALAGEQARKLYANRAALGHLRQALALGHPDGAMLHEAIGDLEVLVGDYRAALASYDTAAAGATTPVQLAALEHKGARVHLRTGDVTTARARLEAALSALADDDRPGLRARIAADRGLAAGRVGDVDAAELEARRALDLAERAGDRRALAQARNILGLLARRAGRLDEAERQLEHSAALAAELADPDAQITARNNLALVLGDARRHDDALAHARAAAQLCEVIGDRHRRAALHNNIADLLHAAGREDEAMAQLTLAVTLFAEVGGPEGAQPEIWKLVDW